MIQKHTVFSQILYTRWEITKYIKYQLRNLSRSLTADIPHLLSFVTFGKWEIGEIRCFTTHQCVYDFEIFRVFPFCILLLNSLDTSKFHIHADRQNGCLLDFKKSKLILNHEVKYISCYLLSISRKS